MILRRYEAEAGALAAYSGAHVVRRLKGKYWLFGKRCRFVLLAFYGEKNRKFVWKIGVKIAKFISGRLSGKLWLQRWPKWPLWEGWHVRTWKFIGGPSYTMTCRLVAVEQTDRFFCFYLLASVKRVDTQLLSKVYRMKLLFRLDSDTLSDTQRPEA